MLTDHEINRYRRQIILPGWGQAGQERLKAARVAVAGAGGLGSAILTYLATAGVGRIRIIDSDLVELSNLNRQMLHPEANLGKAKAVSALERLEALNPDIQIEAVTEKISDENVTSLMKGFLIVDALDNLETRFSLNKASLKLHTPMFHGAVYGFEGRATTLIPGQTPCFACLYKDQLKEEVPVPGVTPGIIGCIQATEVIKYILEVGQLLTNRLLVYDGREMRFTEVKLKKDPSCTECGSSSENEAGGHL